jgi:hypothetical protein
MSPYTVGNLPQSALQPVLMDQAAMGLAQQAPMAQLSASQYLNQAGAAASQNILAQGLQSFSPQLQFQAANGQMMGSGVSGPQTWMGKAGNWLSNGNNLNAVAGGLSALTSAYLGFRQLSLAKDQLKFGKESWAKNFANSQQTYNTSLEDRIRGRTASYDGKEKDVQSYLSRHSLKG